MTIEELIVDLKAAGANENTLRLAMNCYELGQKEEAKVWAKAHGFALVLAVRAAERTERKACAKLCADVTWEGPWKSAATALSNQILARGEQ